MLVSKSKFTIYCQAAVLAFGSIVNKIELIAFQSQQEAEMSSQ